MKPDPRKYANSLSLLKNFTTFVLKRKDNGVEEGLIILQAKNKEDTVNLDEFILEGPDNGVPRFTKIKEVGNNNHDTSQSSSNPQLMLPGNLPPTLSITFNPRIPNSTYLTASHLSQSPAPVTSSNKLSILDGSVGLDDAQPRSSTRLRLKRCSKVTESCGQQLGGRGLDVNGAVAGREAGEGRCIKRDLKGKISNAGKKSKWQVSDIGKNCEDQEEVFGKVEIKSEDQDILNEREEACTKAFDLGEMNTDVKKLYSNNLADANKTICKICQKTLRLVVMRTHTRGCHKISIADYTKQYGNPRAQIINPIFYHKCGICSKEMLLDPDYIHAHAQQKHKISLKEYSSKFLVYLNQRYNDKARNKNMNKNGKPDVNLNLIVAESSMQTKSENTSKDVNIRRFKGRHLIDETNILPPRKRIIVEEENFKGMQKRFKRKKLNTNDCMKIEMDEVKAVYKPFASPINIEPITRNKDDIEIKDLKNPVNREHVMIGRKHVLVDDAHIIVEHDEMRNGPDSCDSEHLQDMLPSADGRDKSPLFLDSWQTESGHMQNIQSGSHDVKKTSSHDKVIASLVPSSQDCGKSHVEMNRSQEDTINSSSEFAANRKISQEESDKND